MNSLTTNRIAIKPKMIHGISFAVRLTRFPIRATPAHAVRHDNEHAHDSDAEDHCRQPPRDAGQNARHQHREPANEVEAKSNNRERNHELRTGPRFLPPDSRSGIGWVGRKRLHGLLRVCAARVGIPGGAGFDPLLQSAPRERKAAHPCGGRRRDRLRTLTFVGMTDTDDVTREAHLAMLQQLSPSERFVCALTLSAYVRQLAWQGARKQAGAHGETAVVDRFLTQLYGADVATSFRASCERTRE